MLNSRSRHELLLLKLQSASIKAALSASTMTSLAAIQTRLCTVSAGATPRAISKNRISMDSDAAHACQPVCYVAGSAVCEDLDLSGLGSSRIISDVERVVGARVSVVVDTLQRASYISSQRILKLCFVQRFSYQSDTFSVDTSTLYDVISFFGRSRDLDLLIDYMTLVYNDTHFPLTRRLFSFFSKALLYNWYFLSKHFGGVGLFMTLSGKLSKQLLTRGQTVRLRVGKTSYGIVKNNVIFRYRQTQSETGAYGLTIYYFTRSRISRHL